MDKRFWRIVEYAYKTVPMYMKRDKNFEELHEWTDIPVLEKTEILKNSDSFFSISFFAMNGKNIVKRHTYGTTGRCLELNWSIDDYKKSLIPVWVYRKKYYDIKQSDKMCYFYTTSNLGYFDGKEYEKEESRNVKGFSKNNLNHQKMLDISLSFLSNYFREKRMVS